MNLSDYFFREILLSKQVMVKFQDISILLMMGKILKLNILIKIYILDKFKTYYLMDKENIKHK